MSPGRILVDHRGTKGLGDTIAEMAFYRALSRQFPAAELVSRGGRTLAWGNPWIAAFDESTPEAEFDQVIRVQLPLTVPPKQEALTRGLKFYERFLLQVGFDLPQEAPELYVLPRELEALGLEDDGGDDLIIAYSADSRELDRRWGEERFQDLARYLEAVHGASLVEIGSGLNVGHLGVGLDLVGQTDLRQTMALLSLADLFIGNHGGLTHMAGALGTPILSPWGASHPYSAFRYDDWSVAIEPDLPCKHCRWTGKVPSECWDTSQYVRTPCTQAIDVAQMVRAADALIPRLKAARAELKRQKELRRQAARDPVSLARFEHMVSVSPESHVYMAVGDWDAQHGLDQAASRKIVAFPDWLSGSGEWETLVSEYLTCFEAGSPYVLMLAADPLTGREAGELLMEFVYRRRGHVGPLPRMLLILGRLDEAERQALVAGADAFVSLGSQAEPTLGRTLRTEQLASLKA